MIRWARMWVVAHPDRHEFGIGRTATLAWDDLGIGHRIGLRDQWRAAGWYESRINLHWPEAASAKQRETH